MPEGDSHTRRSGLGYWPLALGLPFALVGAAGYHGILPEYMQLGLLVAVPFVLLEAIDSMRTLGKVVSEDE